MFETIYNTSLTTTLCLSNSCALFSFNPDDTECNHIFINQIKSSIELYEETIRRIFDLLLYNFKEVCSSPMKYLPSQAIILIKCFLRQLLPIAGGKIW